MSNDISNKNMMLHILNNLPEEYDTVVEAIEKKVNDLVNLLTHRNLKSEIKLKYKRIKKNKLRLRR